MRHKQALEFAPLHSAKFEPRVEVNTSTRGAAPVRLNALTERLEPVPG